MNIKRAKQEIKDTIEAYLAKDVYGEYRIPQIRQRPVLLLGAPGIGKTQIMEQIAKECGIGLVAYTITHHTRQSAIGLPYISKHMYGEKEYAVTEYTMSEIVASLYDKMEKTGLQEGILFIDEINCVSETLAPAMLQFLQCKTFGNHEIPKGWIIVAAGNPPEYNKSVREFDVVTMDRVKKIDVEPDFAVWKEYAVKEQLHPAVISYLNTRTANFYRMETTVDGRRFATPRGWEDLSQMLTVYEQLNKTMDRDVVVQYIQHEKIAKDFANYLELYYKYQMDYQLDAVLAGQIDDLLLKKAAHAPFDERLSVTGLLLARCRSRFAAVLGREKELELLFEQLKRLRQAVGIDRGDSDMPDSGLSASDIPESEQALSASEHGESQVTSAAGVFGGKTKPIDGLSGDAGREPAADRSVCAVLHQITEELQQEWEKKKAAELLTRREDRVYRNVIRTLEEYARRLTGIPAGALSSDTERTETVTVGALPSDTEQTETVTVGAGSVRPASAEYEFGLVRGWFNEAQDALEQETEDAGAMLEHAFDFMEAAFGNGQELVIFITELNSDYYSTRFLEEYECERYYRYNRQLLFDESGAAIEARLRELER